MHSMHSMHSTHERRVAATKSVRGATWGGMGGAVTRGSGGARAKEGYIPVSPICVRGSLWSSKVVCDPESSPGS